MVIVRESIYSTGKKLKPDHTTLYLSSFLRCWQQLKVCVGEQGKDVVSGLTGCPLRKTTLLYKPMKQTIT